VGKRSANTGIEDIEGVGLHAFRPFCNNRFQ
jgi:hypothetical protein